jgi:MFS family permease
VGGERLPLTLAAFLLIGGSLGDRFGRRKVYMIGTVWFALGVTSIHVLRNLSGWR